LKTGLRPLTDCTAVRPHFNDQIVYDSSIGLSALQSTNIQAEIGPHSHVLGNNFQSRRYQTLDSQASQASRPAEYKIHTLKRTAKC